MEFHQLELLGSDAAFSLLNYDAARAGTWANEKVK